jgi:hypothetical protein
LRSTSFVALVSSWHGIVELADRMVDQGIRARENPSTSPEAASSTDY